MMRTRRWGDFVDEDDGYVVLMYMYRDTQTDAQAGNVDNTYLYVGILGVAISHHTHEICIHIHQHTHAQQYPHTHKQTTHTRCDTFTSADDACDNG